MELIHRTLVLRTTPFCGQTYSSSGYEMNDRQCGGRMTMSFLWDDCRPRGKIGESYVLILHDEDDRQCGTKNLSLYYAKNGDDYVHCRQCEKKIPF